MEPRTLRGTQRRELGSLEGSGERANERPRSPPHLGQGRPSSAIRLFPTSFCPSADTDDVCRLAPARALRVAAARCVYSHRRDKGEGQNDTVRYGTTWYRHEASIVYVSRSYLSRVQTPGYETTGRSSSSSSSRAAVAGGVCALAARSRNSDAAPLVYQPELTASYTPGDIARIINSSSPPGPPARLPEARAHSRSRAKRARRRERQNARRRRRKRGTTIYLSIHPSVRPSLPSSRPRGSSRGFPRSESRSSRDRARGI